MYKHITTSTCCMQLTIKLILIQHITRQMLDFFHCLHQYTGLYDNYNVEYKAITAINEKNVETHHLQFHNLVSLMSQTSSTGPHF